VPSTKFKKRNLARYKKTYPFVQRSPRWGLISDKDVTIETADVQFSNENEKYYFFSEVYPSLPIVNATVKEPDGEDAFDSASVSVTISELLIDRVKLSVSENITGSIQLHIIYIKES